MSAHLFPEIHSQHLEIPMGPMSKQQLIKSALILDKWAAVKSNCVTYVSPTGGPVQPWVVSQS